ncbi:Uncharacterised protein [Moraxella lacunata]|uniref:Uncharacterized protein n=1 Tax=Moraxella lacunata TaxID=477 RepID=A0A378T7R1_MORLA|nr:hypothetical protein [Moraxella lacunata]STZ55895.1 Uncharacterised protein [Moraxella lacunata]
MVRQAHHERLSRKVYSINNTNHFKELKNQHKVYFLALWYFWWRDMGGFVVKWAK